jgi:CHAT domain-containing protein
LNKKGLAFLFIPSFFMSVFALKARQSPESLLNDLANSTRLSAQGEHTKALTLLKHRLELARLDHVPYAEQKCLVRLAMLQWDIGNIPESLFYFLEARGAYRKVSDRRSDEFCSKCIEIIRLYSQAKEERIRLKYDLSTKQLEQAIHLGRETGFPNFELKCLRQLGANSWDRNQLADFFKSNVAGLKLAVDFSYKIEEGRYLNNIGIYYKRIGYLSHAAQYLEKAQKTAKLSYDRPTEAESLNNLGLLYREIGDSSKARSFLSSAYRIDNEIGDLKAVAIDLVNMAAVSLRKGIDENSQQELINALDLYQRSLKSDRLEPYFRFVALNNKGVILNEQGMHNEARNHFWEAIKVLGKDEYLLERGSAHNNIASTYLYNNDCKNALSHFRLAREIGLKVSPSYPLMESYVGMGQCYEAGHDNAAALLCYQKAMEVLDGQMAKISSDIFMIGYARNKYSAYYRMLNILVQEFGARPSRPVFANLFSVIEKAKAKAFLEKLRRSANKSHQGDQRNTISRIGPGRELENRGKDEKENNLRMNLSGIPYQREFDWRTGPDVLLEETQKHLIDDKAIVLEYFLGDDRSYLLSISKETFRLYLLPGRSEIFRSIRGFLKILSDPSIKDSYGHEANERIVRTLLPSSLLEELKGYRSLVIMPDGVLYYLPFEALRIPDGRNERFLIESWTISYCPSVSIRKTLQNRRAEANRDMPILTIGDIRYDRDPSGDSEGASGESIEDQTNRFGAGGGVWHDLPFSKKEVATITSLFSKERVRVLLGDDVNEGAVKSLPLKDYGIIHFACHGYYDEIDPIKTGLVLTSGPAEIEDGLLRIDEIEDLDIGADLVVLSTCRSGRGCLENGEGLINLARPFFFAGAHSVIASLWPINDRSTARFMADFYKALKNGNKIGEALRNAKIRMIQSSLAHPFFWAGFVLQGNPGS